MGNLYNLENDVLRITASNNGAELQSIYDKVNDLELLWQGDRQYWGRRAPILFPIVGRLKNDELIHKHQSYPMTQHGFARDNIFECIYNDECQLEFRLRANDSTRAQYPFEFELIVAYHLINNVLTSNYIIRSARDSDLPFSVGGHPAFNWPLVSGIDKHEHSIQFADSNLRQVRQLNKGLLQAEKIPSPIVDQTLVLSDELFQNDALIFDDIIERKITYQAGDQYKIVLQFDDFPQLGIWSKLGAPFVCLEPWYGYASPETYKGEFSSKPGVMLLPSQGEVQLAYSFAFYA